MLAIPTDFVKGTLIFLLCQHVTGEIVITGHETPLIVGLPRDITCAWNMQVKITKMEWVFTGLDTILKESEDNSTSVVLSLNPNTIGLDGTVFTCRVTTSNESLYEETITLEVKGDILYPHI